eukprot:12046084-Alexandrium_andersonii.AAC.1
MNVRVGGCEVVPACLTRARALGSAIPGLRIGQQRAGGSRDDRGEPQQERWGQGGRGEIESGAEAGSAEPLGMRLIMFTALARATLWNGVSASVPCACLLLQEGE